MSRQILFYLLVLFVIFMIMRDASGAGELGNSFFEWVSTGFDKAREFFNSLLGDDKGESSIQFGS